MEQKTDFEETNGALSKLTKQKFDNAVKQMLALKIDGCWHYKIGEYKGKEVAIVLGWSDGYDENEPELKPNQIRQFGRVWTLCAKIAIGVGNMQCDFEYDWVMPSYTWREAKYEHVDPYDTEHAVNDRSLNFLKTEAEAIIVLFKHNKLHN